MNGTLLILTVCHFYEENVQYLETGEYERSFTKHRNGQVGFNNVCRRYNIPKSQQQQGKENSQQQIKQK